jgi:hypothetical protein
MEFILRKVKKKDGSESNEVLGSSYELYSRRSSPNEVIGLWELSNKGLQIPGDLFGAIVTGSETRFLYTDSHYFIMSNSGANFDRIRQ